MRSREPTRQVLTAIVGEALVGVCCVRFPRMSSTGLARGAIAFAPDWNKSMREKA